jgi:AraC-like DNA-binding protein
LIFGQEYIIFELLDVLYLNQKCAKTYNANRNFDAISFRFESDTVIETSKTQIEFSDNSICYIPSNLSYARTSQKDNLIVVHFKSFNYHSDTAECFCPENPEKYRVLFKEILDCWNSKETSYKNECSVIFRKILSEFYKDSKPDFKNRKIQESIIYIEKNYLRSDFSVSDAAAKSFISETYFRKLFKQEFGISPKHYVINRRIEYAKGLIITGYFTIGKIAEMCGYNDEKHFSTEFKKITGVSPSKYNYNFEK